MIWELIGCVFVVGLLIGWLWGFINGCKTAGEIMGDELKNFLVGGYQPRPRRAGGKDKEPPRRP